MPHEASWLVFQEKLEDANPAVIWVPYPSRRRNWREVRGTNIGRSPIGIVPGICPPKSDGPVGCVELKPGCSGGDVSRIGWLRSTRRSCVSDTRETHHHRHYACCKTRFQVEEDLAKHSSLLSKTLRNCDKTIPGFFRIRFAKPCGLHYYIRTTKPILRF